MNAETERDPFLSIAGLCRPTASQEAKFPDCPFARESEIFTNINSEHLSSSPDPTPSEPTGIVMVTPPGSTSSAHQQAEEDAVFHTPPEHHLPTYFSSEDRNLEDISSDGGSSSGRSKRARVREVGSDDDLDSERTRLQGEEFGGQTVSAVETELVEDETELIVDENECVHDDTEVIVPETPGSGEKMPALDLVVRKACELSKDGVLEVNCIDGNCRFVEDAHANKGNTNIHHEGSLYSVKSKEKTSVLKSNGGTEKGHESGVGGSGKVSLEEKKSIEKIDKFRYVGGGSGRRWMHKTGGAAADNGFGRRRQLPVSLEGKGKNAGGEKAVDLKNSLDVLKVLVGYMDGGCEDIDLLGIAKRRGLTFPRPRWWPAEGDDE